MKLSSGATPKLGANDPSRSFYRYYAGFSEAFVGDALARLGLANGAIVLDPWNGAGTTTTVAVRSGYRAIGVDRNPVLAAIATARGLRSEEALSILLKVREGVGQHSPSSIPDLTDPLLTWFSPASVATFRTLQTRALTSVGLNSAFVSDTRRFTSGEAIVHVAFFRAARRLAVRVFGSNPTWIKQHQLDRRIAVPRARLLNLVIEEIGLLQDHFFRHPNCGRFAPRLFLGDTTRIEDTVADGAGVSAVITSPPYGTRIDYGIAMAIELACLAGFRNFDGVELRRSLIGTTITSHMSARPDRSWGKSCNEFLTRVRRHRSKASSSYYSRYYENYFSLLLQSFRSIDKLLHPKTPAVFVVQGSFYKEIYLDLGSIAGEMLGKLGWQISERVDREVKISFTLLNPSAKHYPKAHPPIESVLFLRK